MDTIKQVYAKKFGPPGFPINIGMYFICFIFYLSFISLIINDHLILEPILCFIALVLIESLIRNCYLKRRPDTIVLYDDSVLLLYFFDCIKLKYSNANIEILDSDEEVFLKLKIKGWLLPFVVGKGNYHRVKKEFWHIYVKS